MSSSRSRALRRRFWGSPVLWHVGRILDALRPVAAWLTAIAALLALAVLGSIQL